MFTRFLDNHFDGLGDDQLVVLQELLALEDHDLWALVNGSKQTDNKRWEPLLALLRSG